MSFGRQRQPGLLPKANKVQYVLCLAGKRRLLARIVPEMRKAKCRANRTGATGTRFLEERISIVGRIESLLALHGIWLSSKNIGIRLQERLDAMKTGEGRPLASFLRSDIERMLTRHELISRQIAEVEADCRVRSRVSVERVHFVGVGSKYRIR